MPNVKGQRPRVGSFCVAPWQTKRRRSAGAGGHDPTATQEPSRQHVLQPAVDREGSARADAAQDDVPDADLLPSGTARSRTLTDWSGVATVAWTPSGQFSGHFVDTETLMCFGLHGEELLQIQECTRDEDKRLLLFVITDYRQNTEIFTAVEKTGGDAAQLHTPALESAWEEELRDYQNLDDFKVEYSCRTLESGEKAEEYVRKFLPALGGKDAVVTKGILNLLQLPFPPGGASGALQTSV